MLAPYIIIISVGLFLIALFNILLTELAVWYCVVMTLANFVLVLGVDIIFAAVIHAFPIKLFSPFKKFFHVFAWEDRFYERIGINFWKTYVAELGGMGRFRKNKVNTLEPKYLLRFLQENCCGELIHWFCMFAGVANLALIGFHFLNFALPVILVNFVLHLAPVFIQRYNRPRLLRVYSLAKRKEERQQKLMEKEAATKTDNAEVAATNI